MKDERPPDDLIEVGRGLLDRQKHAAGEELRSVADVMRECAHSFERRQEGGLADYVAKAAELVDRASLQLREREVGDLLGECENALRKHPAIFLAATAVAGFAVGRALRAPRT